MKIWTLPLAVAVFLLSFVSCVLAQETYEESVSSEAAETITVEEKEVAAPVVEKKGPVAVMKKVTGEVSAIDMRCIAVVYKHDAETGDYELPITIKDKPRVQHIGSISQIGPGDIVTVEYEQMTEMGADGKEITGDKFAKTIIFLKPAPPPPLEREDTENPLDSEQDEQ